MRSWRLFLARPIVQIVGALLLAVLVPAYARVGFTVFTFDDKWLNTTLLVTGTAVLASYITFTNLTKFPNVKEGAFIFITVTTFYAIGAFILLFSRARYSGYLFLSSFLISVVWFYVVHFSSLRAKKLRFAVVPGGMAGRLIELQGVEWSLLKEPQLSAGGGNGVVADLRVDFSPHWVRFITDASLQSVPVFHAKQVYETLTGRVDIEHLSENNLGSLVPGFAYVGAKRAFDFIIALVLLPLLSPMFALIAIAIRWDSPGPILYQQRRIGYRGAIFTVYKFRTMKHEPDEQDDDGAPHKFMTTDDDDRVTKVGRWLRKKRLDEFPQMINILRGELSFIGPRPEAMALSRWYERELPFYRYRHIVRPGITGWAQINQGHVTEMDLVLGKLHYDFYYIKNFSPWLDLLITLKTMIIMARGIGAR